MLTKFRQRCAGLLLLTAVILGSAGADEATVAIADAPDWSAPLPSLPAPESSRYRNAPLVYVVHDTQILAKGVATERYEHHAYRINQPAALNGAGTVSIPYSEAFQSLAVHFLRIRREGKTIDLSATADFRVVNQESGLSRNLLVGNGTAVAQVPDLRVGDIVEYAYTIKGNNPVFGDRAAFSIPWNSPLPVAMRRLRIINPARDLELRVVSPRGVEALDLRRVETPRGQEILVEGRDLPVARIEPNMPAALDPLIMIAVTPFASWQEVGRWGNSLFQAESSPSAAYQEVLNRLKKMPSKRNAVAEAVRFVQDDIRYFSLSIGESSHRPYAPSEVIARRWGDCKDKSLLLSSLLRALGIEAQPALVSSTRKAGISRFPPMPNVFDHVVTNFRFEGKDYWIDPTRTSAGAAFDKQGVAFAGSKALRIGSADPTLADIPEDGANAVDISEIVDVRGFDEPVAFRIESRLSGITAIAIRNADGRRGREASERNYLEAMARRYTDVKTAAPLQVRDQDGFLVIKEHYEVGQFFRAEGLDKKIAPLGAQQLLQWLGSNSQRDRTYPFAIPGGRGTFRYEATVNFPNTIVGREDPISNVVADEHFRLAATRSFRGNTMRFHAELIILKGEVAPADFPAYLGKVKQARQALPDFVLLTAENLTTDPAAQPRRTAERLKEETRALAAGLTKAIDSGNLSEADAAEVYYKRSVARSILRDDKGAMDDITASLRLRPFSGPAVGHRGLLNMRAGRLTTADEDYTKGITLGAEAASTYFSRGQVRFLAGRYAEALADFQQAERANRFGVNRDFIIIWQILAMRALGHDPRPTAVAAFSKDDRHRWPVPIMALMLGETTVADVLRSAESRSVEERDANLCEARFFIGQYQLQAGNQRAAAESFRATLATGIDWFMEYDLAQVALNRLPVPER